MSPYDVMQLLVKVLHEDEERSVAVAPKQVLFVMIL